MIELDNVAIKKNIFYLFMANSSIFKTYFFNLLILVMVCTRVELLPAFKFTGKMVKNIKFTGKW